MSYYVYVLKSESAKKHYVGYTSDLNKRLEEHNAGESRYTRSYRPWRLIYSEIKHSLAEAKKREEFFKTGDGRNALLNLTKG